ncbi:hypothetical protein [Actinomadura opuntiae]|uniref:hypothetical protein n=1 Tax=Actinomadura sp. OS1-43 TaxID=604315 RepID=UPI00255AE57C|nr:hypothetical protein [Actinomadura sp. OS1-43]MDL4812832.1 hypothetical protein [Actinomadura sp. OS1-43]
MKIFGREPAQWLAALAILVELLVAVGVPLTKDQQSYVNAAATAVMGALVAWTVAREKFAALAGGAVFALGQLAVSLGLDVSQDTIAAIGSAITAGLALWLYGKVTPPVSEDEVQARRARKAEARQRKRAAA